MKKKKIWIIILICILVILVAIGVMYLVDYKQMKQNKPVIFSTWGYKYTPPLEAIDSDKINQAILKYVIDKDTKKQDEVWFASQKIYNIEQKEENVFYVYSWVFAESFVEENDEIKQKSGYSIPHKFTLKKNDTEYEVTDYQIPRDGSYYADDMKEMFPKYVLDEMDKVYDGTTDELKQDIENQVNIYFNTDSNLEGYESFVGKVLEETTTYMVVEPNEDEIERKSSDKIQINYGVDHNDFLYGVGRKVLIYYKGYIMETYPAQINTNQIETNGYLDFELEIKKAENTEKKKILNNKEIDEYSSDFSLWYYGIEDINVKVDGKTVSLEDALRSGKITLQGIVSKANKDEKEEIIKSETLRDGGTTIYTYEDYMIIKYHTLDGNRDLWIGTHEMNINNIDK